VLAIWFALVFLFAADEAFVLLSEVPLFLILLGLTVHLVVFLGAYLGSEAFHAFIFASPPPQLLTAKLLLNKYQEQSWLPKSL
jgi:hypothetical protein